MQQALDLLNHSEQLNSKRALALELSDQCLSMSSSKGDTAVRSKVSDVVSEIEALENAMIGIKVKSREEAIALLEASLGTDRDDIRGACIENVISHLKSL